MEAMQRHRRDVAEAASDFGDSLTSLSTSERNPPLAARMLKLGDLHQSIHDVQEEQVWRTYHMFTYLYAHYPTHGNIESLNGVR